MQIQLSPSPRPCARLFSMTLGLLAATMFAAPAGAQVLGIQKISEAEGGFSGSLDDFQSMPQSAAPLGDVDGDGVPDVVLGDRNANVGGPFRGAVWLLFLNTDGTVKSTVQIAQGMGGFTGTLDDGDQFGHGVGGPGDIDLDGIPDLIVGAPLDDDVGLDRGAIYVLLLNANGTVKSQAKLSAATSMAPYLSDGDRFGASIAGLGQLNGAGGVDIAVGAIGDRDGSPNSAGRRGAVYTLFLNTLGQVLSVQKISDTIGGFDGGLTDSDNFGVALAALGDIDGDGVNDLAVGANGDDDGGNARGAVWILNLSTGGSCLYEQKLSNLSGGFSGTTNDVSGFGSALAFLGDNDGDGRFELAVSAPAADALLVNQCGLVFRFDLNVDGTVRNEDTIGPSQGGGPAEVSTSDSFGSALAAIGDLDGDGFVDLLAGASGDDDGGTNHGAAYVLFLDGCTTAASGIFRNDSNSANPATYKTAAPLLGTTWTATVDVLGSGHSSALIVGFVGALEFKTSFGVLLLDPASSSGELLNIPVQAGSGSLNFSSPVPDDASLCGFQFATQGVAIGPGIQLLNAYDMVIGN